MDWTSKVSGANRAGKYTRVFIFHNMHVSFFLYTGVYGMNVTFIAVYLFTYLFVCLFLQMLYWMKILTVMLSAR